MTPINGPRDKKKRGCRWCTHPKANHTGKYRDKYRKWYPGVNWTVTCCDDCYMQDKQCRVYEP